MKRLSSQIDRLSDYGRVTFLSEESGTQAPASVSVRVAPVEASPTKLLLATSWLLRAHVPMAGLPQRSPGLLHLLRQTLDATTYDLVWVYRLETWSRLRDALPQGMPLVIDVDDDVVVAARRPRSTPGISRLSPLARSFYFRSESRRYERMQSEACRSGILAFSNPNDTGKKDHGPCAGRVVLVRNALEPPTALREAPRRRTRTIGFVGFMRYGPNRDCAVRLASGLARELRNAVPGTTVRAIGEVPEDLRHMLVDAGVETTGFVPDLAAEMRRLDAMLIPLVSGAGTRVKAVDALANGVPVISTSLGVDGLGLKDGESVLLAESDQEFADAWSKLSESPDHARHIAENAHSHFLRELSSEALDTDVQAALRAAGCDLTRPTE